MKRGPGRPPKSGRPAPSLEATEKAVRWLYQRFGVPPSISMVSAAIGIGPNAVHRKMRRLVDEGKLVKVDHPGRGYTLPELVGRKS